MVPAVSDRIPRVPPYSGYQPDDISYVYRTLTSYGRPFHTVPLKILLLTSTLQPRSCLNKTGLGYFHFARHYSENHFSFLFLPVVRCFSSQGLLLLLDTMSSTWWVAPFGNSRIDSYLHFPETYRSLSRPSSPVRV